MIINHWLFCLSKRALCTIKMEDLLDEAIVDLYNAFEQCRTYGLEHVHTEILMNYSKTHICTKDLLEKYGIGEDDCSSDGSNL